VVVVATLGVVALRREAENESLRDAGELASAVGRGVIQSQLTAAVVRGDPAALGRLDKAVRGRVLSGLIVRVKIWTPQGRILYSDNRRLTGRVYPPDADLQEAFESGRVQVELSDLKGPENVFERPLGRLVEVYLPLRGPNGERLVAETYQRADRIGAARHRILQAFTPVLLVALLALALAQAPLGWWLTRSQRAQWREREELAQAAHDATDEERRRIAHDLHDGVVQDLAGSAYELRGTADRLATTDEADVYRVLRRGADVSRESMAVLRTLLVDLTSPDNPGAIAASLETLVRPLRTSGLDVTVVADVEVEPEGSTNELLYRAAREALRNVARHAGATRVTVDLHASRSEARLVIVDDGRGMDTAELAERRAVGHMGLVLLTERVHAVGGQLSISSQPGKGTRVTLSLPISPPGSGTNGYS
jgi:signal transduction histidine kinase